MEFLIPLTILGFLFLAWHTTAKSSIAKGHSQILSYLGGVVTGLLAAILLFLILAPKEVPDVATQLSQTVEAPPQAPEVLLPQEQPPKVSSLPDAPALPLAPSVEEAEAELLQEKTQETKEPSLSDPALKKNFLPERLATASQRPGKLVKLPQALTSPPERQAARQEPLQLSLTATAKEVWIQVSIDGGPVQRVRLEQGKSVSWNAQRGYKLSLDDAGGVRANLNGKALPRLGRAGQSRHNIVIPSRRTSTAG